MFNEYDVVKSRKKLSESVNVNTSGTIVMVYKSDPNQYEVEFVDLNGKTIELLTVGENDLELVQHFNQQ